ncbi:hypothetical protein V8C34DRAFT_278110 [Trichoderma compactum]
MIPKIRACCRLIVKGGAAFCFHLLLLSMRVVFFGQNGSRMVTLVIKIRRRLSCPGFGRLTLAATGLSLHGR